MVGMWGSSAEESGSPKSGSQQQADKEAEVGRAGLGGTPLAGLGVPGWVVTAISSTAGDVDVGEVEGFSHVEALAPRGGCAASDGVAWVPQSFSACRFQTLIHRAAAVNEESFFRGTPVGAVPLTAVTLQAVWWQVLNLQDWARIAFGGVAAPQEVEGVVVVESGGAWAARKDAAAFHVALILWILFQAPVGYHIHALISRFEALHALVPAPLTGEVCRGTGSTFKVAVSGKSSIWTRVGLVAQV